MIRSPSFTGAGWTCLKRIQATAKRISTNVGDQSNAHCALCVRSKFTGRFSRLGPLLRWFSLWPLPATSGGATS